MNAAWHRMREDRHVRDSARALVEADLENLKADLNHRGLGARAVKRVKDGAIEVYDEAVEVAADHKGVLAALIAAIFVWFARHPIQSLFDERKPETGE